MADGPVSPRDPLNPDTATTSRQRSPDGVGSSERKRRRKVLSCYDCRRRKLQCDRALPACSRCTKAGTAADCLYLDDVSDATIRATDSSTPQAKRAMIDPSLNRSTQQAGPPTGDLLSRLEYQDRRIKQLEAALSKANGQDSHVIRSHKVNKFPMTPESIQGADVSSSANDREAMLFRGRSFKTLFFGTTHPGGLIAFIPELGRFTKEAFERFPTLHRIRTDMETLGERLDGANAPSMVVDDNHLKELLPTKAEADHLVQIYLDSYDCIYHIIDRPSFQKAYLELWYDMAGAPANLVAVLLLMMACSYCLSNTQPWLYSKNNSVAREKSVIAIHACEDWISRQSYKHVTAENFQIRCLIFLAKQVVSHKFKRQWTEAGSLLRLCMSAGLHRHPDLLRKETSTVDKELRRRIWATVVEFELQASFDRGMISAPWLLQSDCSPVSNIHDDDLANAQIPTARPTTEFTTASYLSLSEETVMLRSTLNAVLNNIRQTLSSEEVKQYTEELESHLRSIPTWKEPASEGPHALSSLKLLQYLLVLHERHVRQSTSPSERKYSKMVILDTVTRILAIHKTLLDKGNYSLLILLPDQMRVALSIAYLHMSIDPLADSALALAFRHTGPHLMEDAIDLMHEKVVRFGREQHPLWICVAAKGFMQSQSDPTKRLDFMREAVEKISQPYYKIMACQQDGPSVPAGMSHNGNGGNESDNVGILPTVGQAVMVEATDLPYPPLLDLDDIAAWTFEDWSFNPAAFPQPFDQPYDLGQTAFTGSPAVG